MPTPLELLFDPISLIVIGIFVTLIIVESMVSARLLKPQKYWKTRCITAFFTFFFLSSYLPMIWSDYFANHQLFNLTGLPTFLAAIIGLLLYELFVYVWHRSMHASNTLWRGFHQMHHSIERLDSYSAFYFHPLDMVGWTVLNSLALVWIVGLSADAATIVLYITTFMSVFQHTNIKTPQWLGYIIQRPESHQIHHSKHAKNYSDLPLFDILFGTFENPKEFTGETGLFNGASMKIWDLLCFRDVSGSNSRKKEAMNSKS